MVIHFYQPRTTSVLLFTLNVDWFQRTTHSTGVMYLAIQNLPRKERYLCENVIVVGVIPGPKEPKKTMNSFLQPLVDELLTAVGRSSYERSEWNKCFSSWRTYLCCLRYSCCQESLWISWARLGCSKCLKQFPTETFGQKPDFSGFNRSEWTPRNVETHRRFAYKQRDCNTRNTRAAQTRLSLFSSTRITVFRSYSYVHN